MNNLTIIFLLLDSILIFVIFVYLYFIKKEIIQNNREREAENLDRETEKILDETPRSGTCQHDDENEKYLKSLRNG